MGGGKVIDPWGAPEFFCAGLAFHQIAAPGIVRFVFYADEGDPVESIVRVKLLLPAAVIPGNQLRTRAFLANYTTGMPMPIRFA